jgi:protein-disulfide isomerase
MKTKLSSVALLLVFAIAVLGQTFMLAQAPGAKPAGAQAASAKPAAKPAAQSSAPPPVLLPRKEQVDAAMQRTLGYDPNLTWTIVDIRPSAIPGLVDVVLSINKQAPQHIYLAPGSQEAIIGERIPFGTDPFAPVREKLKAADGPTMGAKTPAMEIVEFSDLECPHCKAAAPIVEKLAADFPQVRVTFQQFPLPASLHPWAMKAALYADCAGNANPAAFWKYVDAIFENQGGIALATADEKLKELATATGLDASKLATCAESKEAQARVQKSLDLGTSLEVTSTPTVFINGRRVLAIGNIPYDQLKLLMQFEIDHAGK